MADKSLAAKAHALRSLHQPGNPLILPNAWDAASAAVIAGAGARAIATTSGGVSWSLGRADGEHLAGPDAVAAVRRIAAAVAQPITADIEAGYGPRPDDVGLTIEGLIDAGAVGANLEDSPGDRVPLRDVPAQVRRLRAARDAAARSGLPDFVLNARTDVFLAGAGDPGRQLEEVAARAAAYCDAGADCLFVPGLLDLSLISSLVNLSPLPVNIMAMPGGPAVAELAGAGVARVSVGTAIAQAAYGLAAAAAAQLLGDGGYSALAGGLGYGELNALFSAA